MANAPWATTKSSSLEFTPKLRASRLAQMLANAEALWTATMEGPEGCLAVLDLFASFHSGWGPPLTTGAGANSCPHGDCPTCRSANLLPPRGLTIDGILKWVEVPVR